VSFDLTWAGKVPSFIEQMKQSHPAAFEGSQMSVRGPLITY